MKTALVAFLATTISAKASNFPHLDALHASCTLTFTAAAPCSVVYEAINTEIT